jgi:hypothetical protein
MLSATPAAAAPLLLSPAARHVEANIRQLPPQKSGDDRLQIATDETDNLNTGTHKGRLEGVRNRPTEKHCGTEGGNFFRPGKRIATCQNDLFSPYLPAVFDVDQNQTLRDVKDWGDSALPMGNRDLHAHAVQQPPCQSAIFGVSA